MGKTWRKHKLDKKEKRRATRLRALETQALLLDAELVETSPMKWVVVVHNEHHKMYPPILHTNGSNKCSHRAQEQK